MEISHGTGTVDLRPTPTGNGNPVTPGTEDDDAPVIPRIPRPRKPQERMPHPSRRPAVPPQAPPAER